MQRRTFIQSTALAASSLMAHAAFGQTTPRRIKVAMIGTAHSHAAGKLETLRKLADLYEVVGVCEPDDKRRQSLAGRKEYAGVPILTEDQLLGDGSIACVFVETAVADLVPTASRVAAAGRHLHLEKPAGPSLPAFKALLDTMAQHKRHLQMGFMFRGNPAFGFLFKAAREGLLGNLFEIHGIIGKTIGPGERRETALFAGGMMFELAVHLIDAAVAILGKPQKVTPHLRRTRAPQDTLADNTLAVLDYPNATATIRSAAMDVEGGARRQFHVCGDAGAASILPLEPPRLTLTLKDPKGPYKKGPQQIDLPKMPGRYDQQLSDFAHILLGQKELDYTPEHDLAVHETTLLASGMAIE